MKPNVSVVRIYKWNPLIILVVETMNTSYYKWMSGCMVLLIFLLVGCAGEKEDSVEETAENIIAHLVEGNYEEVHNTYFSQNLQTSFSLADLQSEWASVTANAGTFREINSLVFSEQGSNFTVAESELEYEEIVFDVRMTFSERVELVGIHLSNLHANAQLPENVMEEEVVIGEGTEFELGGTLTLPRVVDGPVPAVVIVHGSGPSDRDGSAYAYRPYRDIAWGLATEGIAVIRYDKRTYTHQQKMAVVEDITVMEETVEDALLAAQLLREDPRIDAEHVFLAGHSLGGMLAPRIDAEGGNFAGLMILAGSPRSLVDIIYDQNIAYIEAGDLDADTVQVYERQLELEMAKAERLSEMTRAEALEETLFGLPAYYFKEMESFDLEEYLASFDQPILVLHGEDDFQVYTEKDFVAWESLLHSHETATLKSYPGLNHFFIAYEGPDKGSIREYEHPARVEAQVIEDIASWVLENSQEDR